MSGHVKSEIKTPERHISTVQNKTPDIASGGYCFVFAIANLCGSVRRNLSETPRDVVFGFFAFWFDENFVGNTVLH